MSMTQEQEKLMCELAENYAKEWARGQQVVSKCSFNEGFRAGVDSEHERMVEILRRYTPEPKLIIPDACYKAASETLAKLSKPDQGAEGDVDEV